MLCLDVFKHSADIVKRELVNIGRLLINGVFRNYVVMNRLRKLLKEKELSALISNFISLVVLQILNVILPFLTIPYLLRVVGVDKFGLISFALAFVMFFQIIVDYGFNTISTRDISIVAQRKNEVQRIFSEVFITKMILLFISVVVFSGLVFGIQRFRIDYEVYMFTFLMVLGQAIFPIWLFQGLQAMKYITMLNVFFKTIFTLLIFLVVKQESDYVYAPLLTSLGFVFSGITSLWIVKSKFNITLEKVSVNQIIGQLLKAKYLFFSEFQIAFIVNANVILIGLLLNNTAVGYYSTAEKVIRAISNLQMPIINTFYPHISRLMSFDRTKAIDQIKRIILIGVVIEFFGILILFLLSHYIFKMIFGTSTEESVLVFRIMILLPLFIFLDQVFGKLVLLTNNKESHFFKVFFYTSIISVFLCFIMTYLYGFVGTAIANVFVQLFVACGMYYYAKPILKKIVE